VIKPGIRLYKHVAPQAGKLENFDPSSSLRPKFPTMNSPVSPDQFNGKWPSPHATCPSTPEAPGAGCVSPTESNLESAVRNPVPLTGNIITFEHVFMDILQLSPTDTYYGQVLQSFSKSEQLHIRSFADMVTRAHEEILKRESAIPSADLAAESERFGMNENASNPTVNEAEDTLSGPYQEGNDDGQVDMQSTATNDPDVLPSTQNDEEEEHADEEEEHADEEEEHADEEEEHADEEEEQIDMQSTATNDPDVLPSTQNDHDEEETYTQSCLGAEIEHSGASSPHAGSDKSSLCQILISQTNTEFAHESYRQVQRLNISETLETSRGLVETIRGLSEDDKEWSDGSRWAALIETGDNGHRVGSIRTAIRFAGYARWHESQVRWLERTKNMNTQAAANSVFERVIGHKPQDPGADHGEWKRRRQRLSTCYTRGRKWLRLVEAFGPGILFKDVWYVAFVG
jgi:hypothetical protein